MTLWRARDVYRARRGLESLVLFFLVLEGLSFIVRGRWDLLLTIMGFQVAVLWGGRWLLRQAWAWARSRWHGLVLVMLLGLTLSGSSLFMGCQEMGRAAGRLYGYKGDPYPGACAPESVQVGYCVKTKQETKGTP
jgi:hypothetical protein